MILKRSKKVINSVKIATPCHASWDKMSGNEQVRFCNSCSLDVYNISEMTSDDAENLLKSSTGRICLRLYRRHDGTVITKDCPTGIARATRLFKRSIASVIGLVSFLGFYQPAQSQPADSQPAPSSDAFKQAEAHPSTTTAIPPQGTKEVRMPEMGTAGTVRAPHVSHSDIFLFACGGIGLCAALFTTVSLIIKHAPLWMIGGSLTAACASAGIIWMVISAHNTAQIVPACGVEMGDMAAPAQPDRQ